MALVNLTNMLNKARQGKYAIPAFDVSDYRMARAVLDVAEEINSPVIFMGLKPDLNDDEFDCLSMTLVTLAKNAKVEVAIHLDHSQDFEMIKKAIAEGYTSVMIDASQKPFAENVAITKEVVDYAHKYNVIVEAELGHVGDGIVGKSETNLSGDNGHEGTFTKVDELVKFIDETKVDCLAVAIGTSHGVYKGVPKLNLELMDELNKNSKVPLVMHGGSGTPEKDLLKSIELGMCKINIFSDILNGFFSGMKTFLNNTDNLSLWPSLAYKDAIEDMKKVIKEKYELFGCVGKN